MLFTRLYSISINPQHYRLQPPQKEPQPPKTPRELSKTEDLCLRMIAGGGCGVLVDSLTNLPLVIQTRKLALDAGASPLLDG